MCKNSDTVDVTENKNKLTNAQRKRTLFYSACYEEPLKPESTVLLILGSVCWKCCPTLWMQTSFFTLSAHSLACEVSITFTATASSVCLFTSSLTLTWGGGSDQTEVQRCEQKDQGFTEDVWDMESDRVLSLNWQLCEIFFKWILKFRVLTLRRLLRPASGQHPSPAQTAPPCCRQHRNTYWIKPCKTDI